jgi:hypothetical protein
VRIVVLLAVLTAIPVLFAADDKPIPEGWKEVTGGYKGKAFLVAVPPDAKVTASEDSIIAKKYGQIRVYRTVAVRKDGSVFAAGHIQVPPGLTTAAAKERQDFFRDAFLEEVNGTLLEEKKITLGTMPGREYLAKTPTGQARYRLLGTGVQIFRTLVIGTKEQVESKEAEAFLDSFKRTPAEKPPEKDK